MWRKGKGKGKGKRKPMSEEAEVGFEMFWGPGCLYVCLSVYICIS